MAKITKFLMEYIKLSDATFAIRHDNNHRGRLIYTDKNYSFVYCDNEHTKFYCELLQPL